MLKQLVFIFSFLVFEAKCYFCVPTPVSNPATSYITVSPCGSDYEIPLYQDMAAKMLSNTITVDWSLLRNIPATDYNNLINKPIIVNGTNGINGINGVNGIDGINGVNGANGANGANGVDGINGVNGTDGLNGTDGVDGYPGLNCEVNTVLLWITVGASIICTVCLVAFVVMFRIIKKQLSQIKAETNQLKSQKNSQLSIENNDLLLTEQKMKFQQDNHKPRKKKHRKAIVALQALNQIAFDIE